MKLPKAAQAAVLVATGVVLGLGGTALASIPDSGGVIHGCYKPQSNGSQAPLRVIDTALPGGKCPSNQTALTWNQTGPQGPQGSPGDPGPSTAGSAGLDAQIYVTYVTFNNDSGISYSGDRWTATGTGDHSNINVSCPADHPYAISAGYAAGGIQSGNDTISALIPEFGGSSPGSVHLEVKQLTHQDELIKIWPVCVK